VVGSVQRLADGRFDVRYKLLDTMKSAPYPALRCQHLKIHAKPHIRLRTIFMKS
jgi:hypothetical protein